MRTKVLGCSVCKQKQEVLLWRRSLLVICFVCCRTRVGMDSCAILIMLCFFLCWAVRALRVVKKKKVLRVGSCSGSVISL